MATINFELKRYQDTALDRFRHFLRDANAIGPDGANLAFYKATNLPYRRAPVIADGTPYVCLRIPTGGGKTVMGAYAVGIAAQEFLEVKNPMVLWLVPSTPILDQTVAALKNLDHPYRAALAKDFGRNVSVLTKAEALAMSRADAEGGACIIVSTIQSFRREKSNGEEDQEGLKVYQDAGNLMDHFSGLTEAQEARLEQVEGAGRPVASLANLLRLHRPMVIVDEAHNARTALSFDTLARFSPSLILELTATPQTEHDPSREKHASNILYSVSAAELKAEQMIKMPIKLTTDANWQKTIGAGDLKPTGEEFDCAAYLDTMDEVRFWIRNVEGKKTSFWLQLPHQKFYPDFVAMLTDGRILVVEYKGGHLYDGEGDKRRIGAVWSDASDGKCLFCMPTQRGFDLINKTIA